MRRGEENIFLFKKKAFPLCPMLLCIILHALSRNIVFITSRATWTRPIPLGTARRTLYFCDSIDLFAKTRVGFSFWHLVRAAAYITVSLTKCAQIHTSLYVALLCNTSQSKPFASCNHGPVERGHHSLDRAHPDAAFGIPRIARAHALPSSP